MKIKNKEVWIVLISAIFLVSVFAYTTNAAKIITGVLIPRDISLTKDNYKIYGNEELTFDFYLPDIDCLGFANFCHYSYKSGIDPRSDMNKDGKIDEADLYAVSKAFGCKSGQACWSQPIEECFFTSSGRKFKDPTRDCKMNIDDLNLIADHFGESNSYRLSSSCDIYDVCKADINQDGIVNVYDSSFAGSNNGKTADLYERLAQRQSEADLDSNGVVDILDITLIAINFGKDAIERKCSKVDISHISGRTYRANISGVGIAWIQLSYECPI